MVLYSGLVSVVVCVLLVVAISRPFRGFPAALGCFSGLQGGYLNSSEPKGSTRIDLRQKMWQPTPVVACFGLVSFVVCVLLAVAIPAVPWFSCRPGVLQRPEGWLSELQRV